MVLTAIWRSAWGRDNCTMLDPIADKRGGDRADG